MFIAFLLLHFGLTKMIYNVLGFSVDIQFTLLSVKLQRFDDESYDIHVRPYMSTMFSSDMFISKCNQLYQKNLGYQGFCFFPRILVQTIWKTMYRSICLHFRLLCNIIDTIHFVDCRVSHFLPCMQCGVAGLHL